MYVHVPTYTLTWPHLTVSKAVSVPFPFVPLIGSHSEMIHKKINTCISSKWVTVDIKSVTDQCKLSWTLHNTIHCIEGAQSIQDDQVGWTHISILNDLTEHFQNHKMAVCLSRVSSYDALHFVKLKIPYLMGRVWLRNSQFLMCCISTLL